MQIQNGRPRSDERKGERNRRTDTNIDARRHTDRKTDKQTDLQTYKLLGKQTSRHKDAEKQERIDNLSERESDITSLS